MIQYASFYIDTANYSNYQKTKIIINFSGEFMRNKIVYKRSIIKMIKKNLKTSQFQSISQPNQLINKMSQMLFQSQELEHVFRYLIREQEKKLAIDHKKLTKRIRKDLFVQKNIKRYIAQIIKTEYLQSRSQKQPKQERKTEQLPPKNMYLNSIPKIKSKSPLTKTFNYKQTKQKAHKKDKHHRNIMEATNELGHFLNGDKVQSITDTYQIKNNNVDETICLVEWKSRCNGQVVKPSLISMRDIQYYDPLILIHFLHEKRGIKRK